MKRILILSLILIFTLTSCVTALKTQDIMEDVKAPVEDEKVEKAPVAPVVPGDTSIPVTPETIVQPEETETPEDVVVEPVPPVEAPEEEKAPEDLDSIVLDENETQAVEIEFKDITEEELQEMFEAITGGEAIEFPVIPIE